MKNLMLVLFALVMSVGHAQDMDKMSKKMMRLDKKIMKATMKGEDALMVMDLKNAYRYKRIVARLMAKKEECTEMCTSK